MTPSTRPSEIRPSIARRLALAVTVAGGATVALAGTANALPPGPVGPMDEAIWCNPVCPQPPTTTTTVFDPFDHVFPGDLIADPDPGDPPPHPTTTLPPTPEPPAEEPQVEEPTPTMPTPTGGTGTGQGNGNNGNGNGTGNNGQAGGSGAGATAAGVQVAAEQPLDQPIAGVPLDDGSSVAEETTADVRPVEQGQGVGLPFVILGLCLAALLAVGAGYLIQRRRTA